MQLLSLRPDLQLNADGLSLLQAFQNTTLRPILKMLNDKICLYSNLEMPKLTKIIHLDERRTYVANFYNKNPQKARFLMGMVCGFFTDEEFSFYLSNQVEVNKRIKEMCIERIATNQSLTT
jgi:hypothetical protein